MSCIVVDASVALAWVLTSQRTSAADAIRKLANADLVAPFLFSYEVRNALRKAERAKRISAESADLALQEFETMLEVQEPPEDSVLAATMKLARAVGLSVYHANYLELAMRLSCRIATRDAAILAAAATMGVRAYDAR